MKNLTKAQSIRARHMASAMRAIGDGCTADKLLLKGFTREEIETLGETATEIANAESERPGKLAA